MGCTGCHNPHSSDDMALLVNKPSAVCLGCHEEVVKKPHLETGVSSNSHPLIDTISRWWGDKKLSNPAQRDKPYYCGSCHDPHSTDAPKLFKFNAQSQKDLCVNCHPKK